MEQRQIQPRASTALVARGSGWLQVVVKRGTSSLLQPKTAAQRLHQGFCALGLERKGYVEHPARIVVCEPSKKSSSELSARPELSLFIFLQMCLHTRTHVCSCAALRVEAAGNDPTWSFAPADPSSAGCHHAPCCPAGPSSVLSTRAILMLIPLQVPWQGEGSFRKSCS